MTVFVFFNCCLHFLRSVIFCVAPFHFNISTYFFCHDFQRRYLCICHRRKNDFAVLAVVRLFMLFIFFSFYSSKFFRLNSCARRAVYVGIGVCVCIYNFLSPLHSEPNFIMDSFGWTAVALYNSVILHIYIVNIGWLWQCGTQHRRGKNFHHLCHAGWL